MNKLFAIFALGAGLATAQQSTTPSFSLTPANATRFETGELLGTAATAACSGSDVAVTRTSASVLSIGNGSSATAPQYTRFGSKARAITTAVTATLTAGSATGVLDIYVVLASNGTQSIYAYNRSANTVTLSAGTVLPTPGPLPPNPAVWAYSWTITAGAFDTSGGTDIAPNEDCWVDQIILANKSGSDTTVTITDAQGTVLNILPTSTVSAGQTAFINAPGGIFFDGGMRINAGATAAVHAHWRGARARQTNVLP